MLSGLRPAPFLRPERWLVRDGLLASTEVRVKGTTTLATTLGAPTGPIFPLPDSRAATWCLEAECGLQFALRQELTGGPTTLMATCASEVLHARLHLPFAGSVEPSTVAALATGFALVRLDDNGQETTVEVFPTHASAACVQRLLSIGGHKQTYSIRGIDPLPRLVADVGPVLLRRRDDNGQEFILTRHLTRQLAAQHLEALEREPRHKNVYWIDGEAV